MTSTESRADRFVRELAVLKIPDPAAARSGLWLRVGVALMVVGLVLGASAFFMSRSAVDPRSQSDALALGLAGLAGAVVGSAVFLRFSLTAFLRFWMARQSFDLALLTDRLLEKDVRHDAVSSDASPR